MRGSVSNKLIFGKNKTVDHKLEEVEVEEEESKSSYNWEQPQGLKL